MYENTAKLLVENKSGVNKNNNLKLKKLFITVPVVKNERFSLVMINK